MKKIERIVLTLLFVVLACPYSALAAGNGSSRATSKFNWNNVMDAIIQVESSGNRHAKNGNQVGAMQITPILVKDCNNILKQRKSKKRYSLEDRCQITPHSCISFLHSLPTGRRAGWEDMARSYPLGHRGSPAARSCTRPSRKWRLRI